MSNSPPIVLYTIPGAGVISNSAYESIMYIVVIHSDDRKKLKLIVMCNFTLSITVNNDHSMSISIFLQDSVMWVHAVNVVCVLFAKKIIFKIS